LSIVPIESFEVKLQERLAAPRVWKEVCKVTYTDAGIMHNPYKTNASVGTGTRGTGYTSTAVATTDDTVTIDTYKYCAEHIDEADLAQKTFTDWMEIAADMATSLDAQMDTALMAVYTTATDFGTADIGAGGASTDQITVATSNIDDIITEMKTAIRTAGGGDMADENGMFIIWREADFAKVERLAASQGFSTADNVLGNGIKQGFRYLGVEHYSTSRNTANHIIGGVKQAIHVGVVKSTYGKVKTIVNPVVSGAQISGLGLESRIDYKFNLWNNMIPVVFDINVS
jgi:hypothetical protein